jgi:hypothetical protein
VTGVPLPAAGERIDARGALTLAAVVAVPGDVVLIPTQADGTTVGDIIVVTRTAAAALESIDSIAATLTGAGTTGWLIAVDDEHTEVRRLT